MPLDLEIAKPVSLQCGLTLQTRLVKSAMTENMGGKNGLPTEHARRSYARWADNGWGMILTGNVEVDPRHLGDPLDHYVPDNNISDDEILAAWKPWAAATAGKTRTPVIMQLNHPGRQSPAGAGSRGFWAKSLAPSPVPLRILKGYLGAVAMALVFGTPKEMTQEDIDDVVGRFARGARLAAEAGFSGVELHAAHGYLLAGFLSEQSNRRTDAYGGSPARRAKIVVDIIRAVRAVVPKGFAVAVKVNSADLQSPAELESSIEQLRAITEAGVDFLEISGGTYENPKMFLGASGVDGQKEKSARTKAREAFFLEFAAAIRDKFPHVALMVTGGFRTRQGMEAAVGGGECDLVGIARPAVLNPELPNSIIFNAEVKDQDAKLYAKRVERPWYVEWFGFHAVGAGMESQWYSKQIKANGDEK